MFQARRAGDWGLPRLPDKGANNQSRQVSENRPSGTFQNANPGNPPEARTPILPAVQPEDPAAAAPLRARPPRHHRDGPTLFFRNRIPSKPEKTKTPSDRKPAEPAAPWMSKARGGLVSRNLVSTIKLKSAVARGGREATARGEGWGGGG